MIRKNRIFLTEDDGGGSGGSGEGTGTTTQTPPPAPAFNAKEIASEFANVLHERDSKQPKQFTPEEKAAAQEALRFWKPSQEFQTKFGNIDTQLSAFEEMRDGLTAQNVAIMRAIAKELEDKFEQRLSPVQKMIQEREVAEQQDRFGKAYPALANKKLAPVIQAIGSQLHASGAFKDKSESDSFAILARGVEEVIQQTNPTFKLETNQPTNGRSGNAIPHTSSGSGGGGGNSSGGKSLSTAASILGPVKVK